VNQTLEDFFNHLVETEKEHGNFQPRAIFHQLSNMEKNKDLILDFYQYLFSHDIIRYGIDFNNYEPFTTFTKFGRSLIENKARRTAMFEEFLNIHEYAQ